MSKHVQSRHYSLSIKKCGSDECSVCFQPRLSPEKFEKLHFLPDPVPENANHYKPFQVSGSQFVEILRSVPKCWVCTNFSFNIKVTQVDIYNDKFPSLI